MQKEAQRYKPQTFVIMAPSSHNFKKIVPTALFIADSELLPFYLQEITFAEKARLAEKCIS